jgi:class 3 adenylate cyclase
VDTGAVTFYRSPIGGYRATGKPVVYARRLASVTAKHSSRVLVGNQVADLLSRGGEDFYLREIGLLVQSDGDDRYAFYELTSRNADSTDRNI